MITGLNHITLAVRNLELAFDFYKDILGFKPLLKWDQGAYFLVGDLWFCLSEDQQTLTEPLAAYTHIAFSVALENFEEAATRIKSSGAVIWKDNKSEGNSLYFLDTDGHKLEIHSGDIHSRIAHYRQTHPEKYVFFENSPKIRYKIEVEFGKSIFSNGKRGEVIIKSDNTMSIREETDFEHDAFSPPWFLGLDDSIGKYSREGTMQGEEIQDHYGEALIEMRKIEDVSPDFLEGYTSNKDNFLRNPETIETQASALFYALRNFQKKLNTSKDFLKETLKKTISVSCYSYAH